MIFVDSNIPMYLVGGDHPNKGLTRELLRRATLEDEPLVTDAEVLQEILHRYVATNRRSLTAEAIAAILDVADPVFPVERDDVEQAHGIVMTTTLSAREAIHVAVMRRRGIDRIMSFDRGFDQVPGITRIGG